MLEIGQRLTILPGKKRRKRRKLLKKLLGRLPRWIRFCRSKLW
jgi:hypothetical protein